MPSPAEREQWRNENADLIEFISTPANRNRSRFIANQYDSFQQYGSLTDAQTRATRNVMRELQGEVIRATDEALAEDAPHIFNGTYTINDGTEHLTFQVYTVRHGRLQGKRIIKRQLSYGQFKGFAFLNRAGDGIRVWRSHAEDEVRNERYIVWARILIRALHERAQDGHSTPDDGTEFEFTYAEDSGYDIQASVCCRRCNRALTDPTSIALGIGPECRNREQEAQTTAANPHEMLTPPTLDQIAQSDEAAQDADRALSFRLNDGEEQRIRFITQPDLNIDLPNPPADVVSLLTGGTITSGTIGDDGTVTQEPDITPRERLLMDRITEAQQQIRAWGPYGQQACEFCGRNDFQTPQGRGRHVSACRRNHHGVNAVGRARATLSSFRRSRGIVRNDGMEPSGVTTSEPPLRSVRERLAAQRSGRATATLRNTPGPRTPNLSQLGTRIGGQVWEQ